MGLKIEMDSWEFWYGFVNSNMDGLKWKETQSGHKKMQNYRKQVQYAHIEI